MLEITQKELKENYEREKPFIVTYGTIYQIYYSAAQGLFYFSELIRRPVKNGIGFAKKGRYHFFDKDSLNSLLETACV